VNAAGQTLVILSPQTFPASGAAPPAELQHTFAISEHEITLDQFRRLVPQHKVDSASREARGDTPVVSMHLVHIAAYCNELSRLDGIPENQWCYPTGTELKPANCDPLPGFLEKEGYRLPTAAEWEFACRGGSTTTRFVGEDAGLLKFYAWDRSQSVLNPQPVGRLLPNPFGLFDVYGNVTELCIATNGEPPTMAGFVRRGPSCLQTWQAMTTNFKADYQPGTTSPYLGFRVVRTMATDASPAK
jgi:formylglycine-generating enzyme required for sulfatase activity